MEQHNATLNNFQPCKKPTTDQGDQGDQAGSGNQAGQLTNQVLLQHRQHLETQFPHCFTKVLLMRPILYGL